MKKFILIYFLLFFSSLLQAQTPAHDMAKRLGNGYNFGNVMSAKNEGDWADPIEEFMMDDVAAAGFDHIRLPVRWGSHTTETPPYTIDEAWLLRVEEVVDWATERGLIVVLNAHGEHWFIEEVTKEDEVYTDPAKWERFLAIWTQISAHFKDKSNDELVFELINEPYFNMNKGLVDQLNVELVETVRKDNPDRILMVVGGGDNAIFAPQQMDPALFENEDKLIPWFHYYWPNTFTKYPETNNSIPDWGTAEEYASLRADFENVKQWADNLNLPLYLGEFGSNNLCSPLSRAKYHQAVATLAEELEIPRAIWCAGPKANKTVYNRKAGDWVEGQLQPLFPKTQRKNILFIMVDDLNTDLTAFGNEEVITPTFDQLSQQGIQYANAQCSYPVCGPSRASFLTGTYPERNGITNLTLKLEETAPNLTTLPQYLALNGYRTAAVGKVFDPRNVDDGHNTTSWTDDYKDPNHYDYPEEYGDFVSGNNYRVEAGVSYEKGPEGVGDDGYQDGQFTLEAIKVMNKFSVTEQPFFLSVGFKKPHLPFVAPQKYFDLYEGKTITLANYQKLPEGTDSIAYKAPSELLGYKDIPQTWEDIYKDAEKVLNLEKQRELLTAYYACASYIDAQIGMLVDHLEAIGEKDNTLIIVSSDHGFNLGDHNMWGKHNLLQNSAQVPLIIIDPSERLKESERAVQLIDLYPTICDYAYLPKPTFLQGNSLYHNDEEERAYPLDLAVTYYKRNGKNGYSFKKGNERYTLWTSNKEMTPLNVPYSEVTAFHEEFYIYENSQAIETINEVNNAEYSNKIALLKQDVEQWWNQYYATNEERVNGNLIKTNPSFENGVEEGWITTSKEGLGIEYQLQNDTHPTTSSKSAAFHITSNGGNFSNLGFRTLDHAIGFPTAEAQKFLVKFSVYADVDTELRFQLQLDKGVDKINSETIVIEKDRLYQVEQEITATMEGMTTLRLLLQLGKVVGTIYIDDVFVSVDGALDDNLFLQEAINATEIGFQHEDHKNNVVHNIYLPTQSSYEATVTWTSHAEDLVKVQGDSGLVTTPEIEHAIRLDAEIKYKHLVGHKSFVIKLKGEMSSELKALEKEVYIGFNENDDVQSVTQNIHLHAPERTGLEVQWVSSNSNIIEIDGTKGIVKPTEQNEKIIITTLLKLGEEELIKTYELTVIKTETEIPPTSITPPVDFKLYPNPAFDLLYIRGLNLNKKDVYIFGIDGREVNGFQINESMEAFDISTLQSGVYILQIDKTRKKFIKQ
ncbi:sulfatase-like hydrolase/transferase [Flammeovirga sp. EKP202]|uniref:sulfatase-like hydrolase/transferase n=1 Tax=Flammeovirga sp. EKP202 TaxID=2770592 RepID=UPI00165FF700|nr:sulfatase-like hydrolase/transferase [Flammeovirga sp. EKP202]MBD0405457.1 sulfatase-like hydrolase/transferase [Flammeovirga sp. EKP202]